jgi:nucleoside phosphorylase
MLLLTIAHRGEAQEFIKKTFTQPVDFHFPGVYRGGEDLLLLTNEGVESAILRVSSILTYFGNKIDRVLNMGIAGALLPSLQLNQIYGIRRILHQNNGEKEFPSFLCKETHSKTDCVSASKGIFDNEYAQSLRKFAPIVDRESWGIAFVCNEFGLPVKSYKLISDYAGEKTNIEEIKSKASDYSKHMFDFYKNLSLTKESW